MNLLEELQALDMNDIGRWPFVFRAAAVAIVAVIATGAGANSRFSIGLMITAGMLVGTLFTLFVLPVFYLPFSSRRRPERADTVAEPVPAAVAPPLRATSGGRM